MHTVAIVLNALVSLGSAAFALFALARPSKVSGSGSPSFGENYYARLYAARSIPLGVAAGGAPFLSGGTAVFLLLLVAAGIQAIDAGIGFAAGKRQMIIGASCAAVVHAACALLST